MLLIVAHHYVIHSGILFNGPIEENRISLPSFFYLLFGMWGKTGINCFVMITGYFMCYSSITLRKFIKLYLQVVFYGVVINTIFYITSYDNVGLRNIASSLMPINSIELKFVPCFIMFWLGIPFYNILIRNMNAYYHRFLILWLLVIYSFLQYAPWFNVLNMNYISWFISLYMISSYLRMYPHTVYKETSSSFWGLISVILIILAVISVISTAYFDVSHKKFVYWLVSDSNSIYALLLGISSFIYFKNIKISYSKYINLIGASTFGVLLIHDNNEAMHKFLWHDLVDGLGHFDQSYFWLYAPMCVIAIFIICIIIDHIRIITIEKWFLVYYDKHICRLFHK